MIEAFNKEMHESQQPGYKPKAEDNLSDFFLTSSMTIRLAHAGDRVVARVPLAATRIGSFVTMYVLSGHCRPIFDV